MTRKLFVVAFLLFVISIGSNAQSKDEKAVGDAVEKLRKALVDGQKGELEAIAMDKLTYGHSSGKVQNKAEFVEAIVSGKSDFVTIDLSDQTISISGKTAIVRHRLDATTNDSGKPGEVHLLILLVFQKERKEWKLLARQAVKAPQ